MIIRDKLCDSTWPVYDEAKTVDVIFELVVQVNGKEIVKVVVIPKKFVNIVVKKNAKAFFFVFEEEKF